MKRFNRRCAAVCATAWLALSPSAPAQNLTADSVRGTETPTIIQHIDQADIDAGRLTFQQLFTAGERLFTVRFNILDGQGRPGSTGNNIPDARVPGERGRFSPTPAFHRVAAPLANSCVGCHNQPVVGGSGDSASNVHEAAPAADPIVESFESRFGNERNTPGVQGAGPIELLAREMTADLQDIRRRAGMQARATGRNVTLSLDTKGVNFGVITVTPDGGVGARGVQGVDADLVIKPFSQKGLFTSLRDFQLNAFNALMGIQPMERFGALVTGSDDFDRDGIRDEMTVGDVTATTIFQAALATPGRVLPVDSARLLLVQAGERLFAQIGCNVCHVPALRLNSPVFSEPGPFNPPASLRPSDVPRTFNIDLTRDGVFPRLVREPNGQILVRAFTDLKRHVIGDAQTPWLLNERVVQGGVPTDQFLTRKLWDVGSSDSYGHRGDLTTITEAILVHGGEGRRSRELFTALPVGQRAAIVEFLRSLQVLPEGATSSTITTTQAETLRRRSPGVTAPTR